MQTPAGPEIVEDPNATPEQKASAEYSGPAVLSRGISASEPMNPKNTKFKPSVGVEYVYNSGITGVNVQPNGTLSNASASGVQLNYSLVGEKVYRQDIFSLAFNGSLYHYFQNSAYDGSNDTLTMTWRHRLSRHFTFGLRVSANEFNQNNLLLSGAQYVNSGAGTTLVNATPATEAFDGRVFSLYTQGDVTYQMTSRLSINLNGGGFLTRREATSLYGDTGYQAGADVAYRITRHVTAGVYYSYMHFDYLKIFGGTEVNTVGATYSIAFTPTTELITRLGGSRLEVSGLSELPLNPLLSLLFGTSTTLEATHSISYTPDVNVQIRHRVSNLSVSLGYARGVTPGNGLILTSVRQSGTFGMNYKMGRRWNLAGTAGYDGLASAGAATGNNNLGYNSIFWNGSGYRTIYRNLDWHVRADFHHYLFDNTQFLRNSFVISTGLVWNPGNVLERVW